MSVLGALPSPASAINVGHADPDVRASLPRRLRLWSAERFPATHGLLGAAIFLAAAFTGRAVSVSGPVVMDPRDVLGFLAVWAFFLTLRVADEHKDYADDCRVHPGRVLQRGVVSPGTLRGVGAVSLLVQLAACIVYDRAIGGPVLMQWAIVLGWAGLMTVEFFAPRWLRGRLALYAVLHNLIVPLVILWIARMGAPDATALGIPVVLLASASLASGLVFELARKTRAPEDERDGVATYSRLLGTRRAPLVTLAALAASGVLASSALLGVAPGKAGGVATVVVVAAVAAAGQALLAFRDDPSSSRAKRAELLSGVAMVVSYLAVAGAVAAHRGIAWAR